MHKKYLVNGVLVLPDRIVPKGAISIENGLISGIYENGVPQPNSGEEVLDMEGAFIMPGIIDIHTDALDAEIIPRPGADIPIPIAFTELERKMAGVGYTTVYHSLHLGYNNAELHSRSKYTRQEVFETVHNAFQKPGLLHNKIHLRYEVSGVDAYDTCKEFIHKKYVNMLSVMDHTPGQGQLSFESFLQYQKKLGISDEEAKEKFKEALNRPKIQGEKLESLVRYALEKGIPVASHDDDTPEKVDLFHSYGIDICEFPINMETAHHASKKGMHVVGGASNILRGGSLSGNADMKVAVKERAVDVLCSDYYPPAILHSIFKLHLEEGIPLNETMNLASLNAAKAARIDSFTGSIEIGKSADLMVVGMVSQLPIVFYTLVEGDLVTQSKPKPKK